MCASIVHIAFFNKICYSKKKKKNHLSSDFEKWKFSSAFDAIVIFCEICFMISLLLILLSAIVHLQRT